MASPILSTLEAAVTKAVTVNDSAIALINGIADRIKSAVAAALANGATAEELAPVQAEADALNASADALSAAVVANTPSNPSPSARRP
jgi:hypothetical protein